MDYTCGTTTSVTGSDGSFTYDTAKCSSIEFKLNGLSLGTIATANINTDKNLMLQDLAGVSREDITNETVQKMAVLLQSLDNDNDPTNGIDINSTLKSNIALTGNISSKLESDITTEIGRHAGKVEKDKFAALAHLLASTKTKASSTKTDFIPDTFTFTDLTNQAKNTQFTSDEITVSEIDIPTTISIIGGEYQIGTGTWTSAKGTITNGQKVKVRGTTPNAFNGTTNITLTIGGVSDIFSISTTGNTIPSAFDIPNKTNVALGTLIESEPVTITGLGYASPISVTDGNYSIYNGTTWSAWTSVSGTISNNQMVKVSHTSSASSDTTTETTLTIGGVLDTFTTKTLIPIVYEPASGATNVGVYTWVKMNFVEDINSSQIVPSNFTGASFSTCDYNTSTKTALCKLADGTKFADNTTYTITAPIRALGGFDKNVSMTFTTGKVNKFPLLRTGQTTCFKDTNSSETVACTDSHALKSDGWYASQTTPLGLERSFTRANDIVTDNVTLLQWQDDTAVTSNDQNWTSAVSYCENLNISNFGGHTGWRLPTIDELSTIVNKGEVGPAKFTEFSNFASGYYWSSTTHAGYSDYAWYVYFHYGYNNAVYKTYSHNVHCVRAGQ